jgi:hypothetical protein
VLVKKRSGKLEVEEEAEEADEFLLRALSNWEELKTSGGIGLNKEGEGRFIGRIKDLKAWNSLQKMQKMSLK